MRYLVSDVQLGIISRILLTESLFPDEWKPSDLGYRPLFVYFYQIFDADICLETKNVIEYGLFAGPVNKLARCPGLYCGRELLSNGSWSSCGACPRGYRTDGSSECIKCSDSPELYDWLYLGFMALLALVLHWFSIDTASGRTRYFCYNSNAVCTIPNMTRGRWR